MKYFLKLKILAVSYLVFLGSYHDRKDKRPVVEKWDDAYSSVTKYYR